MSHMSQIPQFLKKMNNFTPTANIEQILWIFKFLVSIEHLSIAGEKKKKDALTFFCPAGFL